MTTLQSILRTKTWRTRAILFALALAALVFAMGTSSVGAAGLMGAFDLIETPAAQNQTAQGACSDTPTTPVCKEVCFVTMEGHIIPQGDFRCTPP